jgi:hypothetical protein
MKRMSEECNECRKNGKNGGKMERMLEELEEYQGSRGSVVGAASTKSGPDQTSFVGNVDSVEKLRGIECKSTNNREANSMFILLDNLLHSILPDHSSLIDLESKIEITDLFRYTLPLHHFAQTRT